MLSLSDINSWIRIATIVLNIKLQIMFHRYNVSVCLSLDSSIKPKATQIVRTLAVMLFYILQNITSKKVGKLYQYLHL
jgi:hypothetical protein